MDARYLAFALLAGVFLLIVINIHWHQWTTKTPTAGETWIFRDKPKDPWDNGSPHEVTILDVREGWVRYSLGVVFSDQRMRLTTFAYCYRPKDGVA